MLKTAYRWLHLSRPHLSRPHLRLIALIGLIVPRRLRADWRQEWEAELQYRERLLADWNRLDWRRKGDLMLRSLGAFADALALQPRRLEDEMFQDLRYGWRMLRKHKGFTLVAVLSLGLGIGANTAQFSLVDSVLLRLLPVREPERLVLFGWESGRPFRTTGMRGTMIGGTPNKRVSSIFRYESYEKLQQAWRGATESPLSDLFAFAPLYGLTAVANESAEIVEGQAVTGGYYAGLGVRPMYGRGIDDADDKPGAAPVVVLSHAYWQDRFGGDPGVVGRTMRLNKTIFTIVGVTPPGFKGTLQVSQQPEVTVPLSLEPLLLGDRSGMSRPDRPGLWWIHLMGRLKPGASIEQGRQSLTAVFQASALELMPPPRKDGDPSQIDPKEYPSLTAQAGGQGPQEMRTLYSRALYGLFGVVALVLLIACANVANLLLARAALRGPEIGLRMAMGAGRFRLIRQLLTESLLLAGMGGAAGVLFAYWGKNALAALGGSRGSDLLPPGVAPSLNWRVMAFTLAVSMVTGLLFGMAPAWRATRADLAGALKQQGRGSSSVSRLSKGLIVAQVAISLLLLVGAGLYIRTLRNLQQVNPGFNPENLLLFTLQPQQGGYRGERLVQVYDRVLGRLDAMPGVRAATFSRIPLLSNSMWNTDIRLPGESAGSGVRHNANRQAIRENYFATMEIPLLRGRAFTPADDARSPRVGIVNQAFANQYFPGRDAVGQRIMDTDPDVAVEIVGVVADSKYNNQRDEIDPMLYTSWRQDLEEIGGMAFALRTRIDPLSLANSVRGVVREIDGALPVTEVVTQTARAEEALGQERLYARLLTFFGALGALLAAIGLSGVLAYSVAQRTNEIGIRMALGALPGDVLRLVIWQGMKLVLLGLAIGGACGYGLNRLLASDYFARNSWQREMAERLYGVRLSDPLTFSVIAALMLLVAILACWLPARRAAQVDPIVALRHD